MGSLPRNPRFPILHYPFGPYTNYSFYLFIFFIFIPLGTSKVFLPYTFPLGPYTTYFLFLFIFFTNLTRGLLRLKREQEVLGYIEYPSSLLPSSLALPGLSPCRRHRPSRALAVPSALFSVAPPAALVSSDSLRPASGGEALHGRYEHSRLGCPVGP